jgi:hypothetical protein
MKNIILLCVLILSGCWQEKPPSDDMRVVSSSKKLCSGHGGVWLYGTVEHLYQVKCFDTTRFNYHTGKKL